jgi:hypothetical protein
MTESIPPRRLPPAVAGMAQQLERMKDAAQGRGASLFEGPAEGLRRATAYPAQTVAQLKRSVAASLAGGMIAASGRPHTAEEAIAVFQEVLAKLYPPEPAEG